MSIQQSIHTFSHRLGSKCQSSFEFCNPFYSMLLIAIFESPTQTPHSPRLTLATYFTNFPCLCFSFFLHQLCCSASLESWYVKGAHLVASRFRGDVTTRPTVCLSSLMSPAATVTCLFPVVHSPLHESLTLKTEWHILLSI